jgi:hypothetical protein
VGIRARRGAIVAAVAASLAFASSASGAVTIGQVVPPGVSNCSGAQVDFVQVTTTVGTPYVVAGDGTITSWNTQQGASDPGVQWKLKVFRNTATTNRYQVVGHDGPRALTPNSLNSFAASVPVKAGDMLGLNRDVGNSGCVFPGSTGGTTSQLFPSDLADGASGTFMSPTPNRLNISATIEPSNLVTLGTLTKNKKKGTAELAVSVPGPGEITVGGKGVKAAAAGGLAQTSVAVSAKGEVKLPIRAKGKSKSTLLAVGKVKIKPTISYTPTGGAPGVSSLKVKLKRN